jgi:uncharacterized protein with PQ loop repeat
MLNNIAEIFGWIGAFFFAICSIPQALKIWKTHKADDLSMAFLIYWAIGEICMWTYVGIIDYVGNTIRYPLHANYFFNSILLVYLIYGKIRYGKG